MSIKSRIVRLTEGQPVEKDWLMLLTQHLNASWSQYGGVDDIQPGTIFFYCSFNALELDDAFLERVRTVGGCGLIHIGDEYFRSDLRHYASFEYIVRNTPTAFLMSDGVHFIPLGFTNDLPKVDIKPASTRKYSLMFAGDAKADRELMARKLSRVSNSFISLPRKRLGERNISRNEYTEILMDSVFAPSPSGNVNLETYRPYEALQMGVIPILPRRKKVDIYHEVLGKHPLPTFHDWTEAAKFCENLMRDPVGLDILQSECLDWWSGKIESMSLELSNFVAKGQTGAFKEAVYNTFNRKRVWPNQRLNFFLMQQNNEQLKVRAASKGLNAVAKLTGRKYSRPNWTLDKPAGDNENVW